jgi:hypothetical protein
MFREWEDIDIAYWKVGKVLGLIYGEFPVQGKRIIYDNNNPITKSIQSFFKALEENGLIVYNDDGQVKIVRYENGIS